MAVQEQTPYIEYVANGDTTSFALGFDCSDQDYLIVLIDNNPPEYGSWYLENNTVIFRNAPQANQKVSIERSTPLSRATNFKSYDNSFRPETINFDFDKLWLALQEQNLIDGKILARLKEEIEWRRTHDLNFDELAKVREAQIFGGLKQYVDTYIASTNPNIFGGVTAGIVFALDQKSVQTHLEEIADQLEQDRKDILDRPTTTNLNTQLLVKADKTYVDQLVINANAGMVNYITEVELLAYRPTTLPYTAKALDTKNVWSWSGSQWINTGLSEKDLAIAHSDAEIAKTNKSLIESIELNKAPFTPMNKNIFEIHNGDKIALSIDEENIVSGDFDLSGIDVDTSLDMIVPHSPSDSPYKYEICVGDQAIIKLDEDKPPIFLGKNDDLEPTQQIDIKKHDSWFCDGANLFFANSTGAHRVLAEKVLSPLYLNDKASIGVIERKWIDDGYQQAIISKEGSVYPNSEKTLLIIPVLGQSLGFGDKGKPALTLTNNHPEYALKFKGLNVQLGLSGLDGDVAALDANKLIDFDPIIAIDNSNGSGENIGVTVAQQLAKQLDDEAGVPMRVLSFTAAVNGTAYSGIKKDTQAYTNLMTAITQATAIAKSKGWNVIMPAFIMQHGEANRTTTVATYTSNLTEYIGDINTDVKAITGQSADIYMYYSNPCGADTVESFNSTQAMYELGKENPLAIQTHSLYPAKPIGVLDDLNATGDMTHLTASGYIYQGYKYVQAIMHDLKHGMGSFKGVYPISVNRTDNLIDIKFNVPKPPLVYKTSDIVRADPTWGLSFSGSTNGTTIQNVEIISDDTVRVTLSNVPTGTNMQIKGGHIPRTASDLATRPRINLADSTEGQTPYGDSLAHWAIAFNELVN